MSRVFHDAPAVLYKIAQGHPAEGRTGAGARTAVWVSFVILHIAVWGGIQDSELLFFFVFLVFLTWNFLR